MSFAQKSMDISNNNYIRSSLMKFKFAFLGEAAGKSIMILDHDSVIYLDTISRFTMLVCI
jgi:hypothetical protein